MTFEKLPVAVLISGGGSTLKNLIERMHREELNIDIRLVISSRTGVQGLEFAKQAGIRNIVVRRKDFASAEAFRDANFSAIRNERCELVVMGGYLQHLLIPDDYFYRVINIHPSLIPAFCGQGYYGLAVHQAVVDFGVKVSGCTVHFVDNEFDHGPIIAQAVCGVYSHDTAVDLQQRVGQLERDLLPRVVQAIGQQRVTIRPDSRVVDCPDLQGT